MEVVRKQVESKLEGEQYKNGLMRKNKLKISEELDWTSYRKIDDIFWASYIMHGISAIIKSFQSADSLCQSIIHTNIGRK